MQLGGSSVHIGFRDFESLLLISNSNVCETTVQVLILILTGVRFVPNPFCFLFYLFQDILINIDSFGIV